MLRSNLILSQLLCQIRSRYHLSHSRSSLQPLRFPSIYLFLSLQQLPGPSSSTMDFNDQQRTTNDEYWLGFVASSLPVPWTSPLSFSFFFLFVPFLKFSINLKIFKLNLGRLGWLGWLFIRPISIAFGYRWAFLSYFQIRKALEIEIRIGLSRTVHIGVEPNE